MKNYIIKRILLNNFIFKKKTISLSIVKIGLNFITNNFIHCSNIMLLLIEQTKYSLFLFYYIFLYLQFYCYMKFSIYIYVYMDTTKKKFMRNPAKHTCRCFQGFLVYELYQAHTTRVILLLQNNYTYGKYWQEPRSTHTCMV